VLTRLIFSGTAKKHKANPKHSTPKSTRENVRTVNYCFLSFGSLRHINDNEVHRKRVLEDTVNLVSGTLGYVNR